MIGTGFNHRFSVHISFCRQQKVNLQIFSITIPLSASQSNKFPLSSVGAETGKDALLDEGSSSLWKMVLRATTWY